MEFRVIFYHKHPTSARTRFMLFDQQTVFYPQPIPHLAQLSQQHSDNTVLHPTAVLRKIGEEWGMDADVFRAEGEFQHRVEVPGQEVQVILASIELIDPPFDVADRIDAAFIDLTEARSLTPTELELLRHAYQLVLGG